MKKKSLLLGTAMAVLLAPGILNNVSTDVDAASVIGVVKRGGGTLFDANGKPVGRVLDNFSSWRLGTSTTINGVTYYKVATNEWLRADSIEIQGEKTEISTGTNTNPTATTKTPGYVGRILKGGTVSVDDNGNYTGQPFANYTAWKLDAKKTINGQTYYRVATNQWINATAMTVRDSGGVLVNETINSTTITKTPGYIGSILKGGTVSYDDKGNITSNAFGNFTDWKLDAKKVVNGITYYRVATNQWINASAMTVTDSTGKTVTAVDTTDPSVDPNADPSSTITKTTGYIGAVIDNGASASSYDDSGNPTGKSYQPASRWQLTGMKVINGSNYYRIATHEWLPGSAIQVYDANGKLVSSPATTPTQKVGTVINYAEIFNDQGVSTKYVLPKNTEWTLSDSKTVSGVLFYKVADNEWIKSDTVTVKDVDTTTPTTTKYTLTTTGRPEVYDTSTNTVTADTHPAGTAYNVLSAVFNRNGQYYFQVGPNTWINSNYVTIKDSTIYDTASSEPDFAMSATHSEGMVAYVTSNSAHFYNDSTKSYESGIVSTGSAWKVFRVVQNSNNQVFYKVGGHEWLKSDVSNLNYNNYKDLSVYIESNPNFALNK